ncbi:MAG TPA: anaerobic glycerol-3-phosphate dehydrogenase subunit GlpB [Negativicutes bacterium]|nr:anaerobic glycerol-3-phosphate dehydrogenase subunit GlpB [Negativicutes bacterium]
MKEYDVIVVGAGLAGLIAAAAAAGDGARVLLAAKGAGAITVGGGTIDILGYGDDGRPVADPAAAIAALPDSHPYGKLGLPAVQAATDFFLTLCAEAGYPYCGSLAANRWLPTAAGTLKPACFVPKTMNTADAAVADSVVILGFAGLRDYRPEVIVQGLSRRPGFRQKHFSVVTIDGGFTSGRDATALDVARWLDSGAGRAECREQLAKRIPAGRLVLLPPVLGTRPDYTVWEEFEQAAGCRLLELAGIPPAVTGFRLRSLLLAFLRRRGVAILEQASVTGAVVANGRCQAVVTGQPDRERQYRASAYVFATGGFLGGGLVASAGAARESVFSLPLTVPSDQLAWSNPRLLSVAAQPFARFGVETDRDLRPLDAAGRVVLDNVHFAGAILAGCDHSQEKSGNGVAVVSGYCAGTAARRNGHEKV